MARRNIPRPHAGGRWTRARYMAFIRSALRECSKRWPPRRDALLLARRKYVGPNPRQKYEYLCAACGRWFMEKEVQVDHIIPTGSLNILDELPVFVGRLLAEADGWQVLCRSCHKDKTARERVDRKKGQ